ncbi:MAG: SpoIIE family protein phosphatase [Planctomycetota bacterium]|nr:SpoIIE family protein phosphatase [Planctomycetota bacterium]
MNFQSHGDNTSTIITDDTIGEFLAESYEGLDRAEQNLMVLNGDPKNSECLNQLRRVIHTIKGTCGCLGYSRLEIFTHEIEDFVGVEQERGELEDRQLPGLLLSFLATIRDTLQRIERTGRESDAQLDAATTELRVLRKAALLASQPKTSLRAKTIGEMLVSKGLVTATDIDEALEQQMSGDPLTIGEILVEKGKVKASDVRDALKSQQKKKSIPIADSRIRVDIDLLDDLLEMITELGITRNRIIQRSEDFSDSKLITASQRLNLLTEDLQSAALKLRMQPAEYAWKTLPKQVMELSRRFGKKVFLQTVGGETEIDRAILDAIKEPLVHLIRNSIDHGIEPPEERIREGKEAAGSITIEAKRAHGEVEISVGDDGRGLNLALIVEKAISEELLSRPQTDQMSEDEILRLILLPGFSTRQKASYVSGRGVGMDIVQANIDKMGGSLEIENSAGEGVKYVMRFPSDVKAVPVLLVTISGQIYGIHRDNLQEILRLNRKGDLDPIVGPQGQRFFRLRDQALPLVDLHDHLDVNVVTSKFVDAENKQSDSDSEANVVIVQSDEMAYGILVDQVMDTEEVVLRPMHAARRDLPIFFGSCVVEDGGNARLIDVTAVAQCTRIFSEEHLGLRSLSQFNDLSGTASSMDEDLSSDGKQRTILVVDDARAIRSFIKLVLLKGIDRYRILEAENGADALAMLTKERVDLIILDFDMPVMNGLELARKVRQDARTYDVKIIMLSARSFEQDKVAGLDAGADEYVTKPIRPSELQARTRAMIRMKALQEELVELERDRHESRIEMAREVQQRLLPQRDPSFNEMDFCIQYRPSEGLGGDFYDYVYGDKDQFSLIVGDAEGHGIRAALLMAQASAFLRASMNAGKLSPAELVESMNRLICGEVGVTSLLPIVCFSFDFRQGTLRYVNAGHVPSLFYSRATGKWLRLDSTSSLLGINEDAVFEEEELSLCEGDILVCFTDGLNEAFDSKGNQFGIERIVSLAEANHYRSAKEIVKGFVDVWSEYETGEGCDDMTLAVAKIQNVRPAEEIVI